MPETISGWSPNVVRFTAVLCFAFRGLSEALFRYSPFSQAVCLSCCNLCFQSCPANRLLLIYGSGDEHHSDQNNQTGNQSTE